MPNDAQSGRILAAYCQYSGSLHHPDWGHDRMAYTRHTYRGHHEFADLRRFLLDTWRITGTPYNWPPRRMSGFAFHNHPDQLAQVEALMQKDWHLWRNDHGQIIAAICTEYPGGVYPQLHPDYPQLTTELVMWAIHHHRHTGQAPDWVDVWVHSHSADLPAVLQAHGFVLHDAGMIQMRADLSRPLPDSAPPPPPYHIGTMRRDEQAAQRMADLLNTAFGRDIHSAAEYQTFQRLAPDYQAEYDFVVYAGQGPDAPIVCTVGLSLYADVAAAVVEPVATHPLHRGHGLAQATLAHALVHAQAAGIRTVWVEVGAHNQRAQQTYQQAGFMVHATQQGWRKVFG